MNLINLTCVIIVNTFFYLKIWYIANLNQDNNFKPIITKTDNYNKIGIYSILKKVLLFNFL